MEKFLVFVFGPFYVWGTTIVYPLVLAVCAVLYIAQLKGKQNKIPSWITWKRLFIFLAAARAFFAAVAIWGQWWGWARQEFTKLLLPPYAPISYFLGYVGVRFFLNAALSVIMGYVVYLSLRALSKKQERFFDVGEVELGAAAAIAVGWPGFVIFLPLIFIAIVPVSIVRGVVWKEPYTTFGWPFIVAAVATMIFGARLIELLGLSALKI